MFWIFYIIKNKAIKTNIYIANNNIDNIIIRQTPLYLYISFYKEKK